MIMRCNNECNKCYFYDYVRDAESDEMQCHAYLYSNEDIEIMYNADMYNVRETFSEFSS